LGGAAMIWPGSSWPVTALTTVGGGVDGETLTKAGGALGVSATPG
jgi:hypothetical protein